MFPELKKVRFPVETGLLLAFCVFLPVIEAPKNIAWLFYVGAWLINRMRARDFGGRWDLWDTLFACWIASAYLSAAFAGLHKSELGGAHELARYVLLGWLVKRGGYSAKEMRWFLGALIVSTLAGFPEGYWNYWRAQREGRTPALQLNSVGQVNHTAIYIAIIFGLCTAWIFARWRSWRAGRRAVAAGIVLLMLVSLIVTASRGAVAVGLAIPLVLAVGWWPRWRAPLFASAVAVAVSAAAIVGLGTEVMRKQEVWSGMDNVLSSRDSIWRTGLAAWERYPWFGVGMDNYSAITYERVQGWRTEAGKEYDRSLYMQHAHAHNLFVNTLAERGTVGFAALFAVLAAWLASLIRSRPAPAEQDRTWLVWGAAASAWIVTVGVGMVNTTLHHEHGMLATLLLGLWLSTRTRRPGS